jgi:hypothetical protein
MKTRQVTLISGYCFTVPQGIQRIDTRATHGWQVRYHGTKMFSDHSNDGSGAKLALQRATKELLSRIAKLPAPSLLQPRPNRSKTTGLPVGISGPIVRTRGSEVRTCVFSVLLPQFGDKARCASVYIGNENTYTPERYKAALTLAVARRQAAVLAYDEAATRAKRREGRAFKAAVRANGA